MALSMRSRILKLKFSFFHYPLISDPSFTMKKNLKGFACYLSLWITQKNKQANNPTQGPSLPGYFQNVKLLRLHTQNPFIKVSVCTHCSVASQINTGQALHSLYMQNTCSQQQSFPKQSCLTHMKNMPWKITTFAGYYPKHLEGRVQLCATGRGSLPLP